MIYYTVTTGYTDTSVTTEQYFIFDQLTDVTSTMADVESFYGESMFSYDDYITSRLPLPTNGSGCIIFIPFIEPVLFIEEEIEIRGYAPMNVRQRSPPAAWRYNYIVKL